MQQCTRFEDWYEILRLDVPVLLLYFQCFTAAPICYERFVLVCLPFAQDVWLPHRLRQLLPLMIAALSLMFAVIKAIANYYFVNYLVVRMRYQNTL